MKNLNDNSINQPVTIGYVASRLRVTSAWLRQEAEAGNIPSLKAGNTYLFDYDTVVKILSDRAKGAGNDKE